MWFHVTYLQNFLLWILVLKPVPGFRNTAKTFYAASIFFEILNQFGPLQSDVSFLSPYFIYPSRSSEILLIEKKSFNLLFVVWDCLC